MAGIWRRVSKSGHAQAAAGGTDLASYRLLVGSLFSSPGSIVPGGIAGILTPYLCWLSTGEVLFRTLTLLVSVVVALRLLNFWSYRRRAHENDGMAETRRWDRSYFLGATVFSAVLGYSCYAALALTDDPAAHITSVASTIAIASGYVARNAGRPKFVAVQLLTFCIPMAVGLLEAHNVYYHYIGYFAFLYIAANIAITQSLHRNLLALGEARQQAEDLAGALHSQNVTLDAAINTMVQGLAMFDSELKLAVSNGPHRRMFGLPDTLAMEGTPLMAITRFLVERSVICAEQIDDLRDAVAAVRASQQSATREIRTRAGRVLLLTLAPASHGGVLILTEDITERKAAEAQIERMAHYDVLTGLANRFEFNNRLARACENRKATQESFALLYIDLDGFKQVNDTLGHDTGDQVLIETAERLRGAIRAQDMLARFGGDEFVLILPASERDLVTTIARRLIETMARPFRLDNRTAYVTASIGIALAPQDGAEPADLLRHADTALYKAKAAGRNTLMFFDPEMALEMQERLSLESDLRQACAERALDIHYQPIIDLKTLEIVSREALMRWRHPTRGMVAPGVFIPVAERAGLIAAMGEWAIRRACEDALDWPDSVSVAVNVSPLQFREPERLIDGVKSALLATGLPSRRLMLEVTESLLIEDDRAAQIVMSELQAIGVRFSLDDFGTGYSSLAYLSTYAFAQVKIDRSFTRDVNVNDASKAVVEAVCQLARRLSMNVVVEGVETEQQRIAVQLLGAQRAQGYLFGRPEPLGRAGAEASRDVA